MYVDELADHDQQVIQWQQQRLAQLDHDGLLPRRQRGGQLMGPMRTVIRVIATFLNQAMSSHNAALRQLFEPHTSRQHIDIFAA